MKLLDIVHPAAKTLVDISMAQDAEVGDGTTSVVVLAAEMLKDEPLCVVNDMSNLLSGFTISYLEFSQGMCQSKTLLRDIYEPSFNSHTITKYDQLKEIASEQPPAGLFTATQIKRGKTKKKK